MNELRRKLGKLLKLERERRSLTLEDISSQLKIPKSNLEHIEAGETDALPSELYFKLFAKSYAEALGIDYSQTVDAIKEDIGEPLEPQGNQKQGERGSTGESEFVSKKEGKPGQAKHATRYLKIWISVFVVIVILFFIFLLVNKFLFSSGEVESPIKEPTEASTESALGVDKVESSQAMFSGYDWDVPSYQEPSDLQLMLIAKSESWATVLADGDTAIFRKLVPGRIYQVTAKYRCLVSIAIPSVVDIELNGQPVDLRDLTTRRISRVRINQMNIDSFLSLHEPGANTADRVKNSGDKGNSEDTSLSPTELAPPREESSPTKNKEADDLAEMGADTAGKVDDER